jgi:uncharacterized membrane protein HdeD (DUF308 family)
VRGRRQSRHRAVAYGVFTVAAVVAHRRGEPHWVALLVNGLLNVVVAVLTFLMPSVTTIVLLYLIAGRAIVTGAAEIATAIRLRKVVTGERLLVLSGALSVAVGFALAVSPGECALAITLWIGAYATVLASC